MPPTNEVIRVFTKGDTLVSATANLFKADGTPIDLNSYAGPAMTFRMVLKSNPTSIKIAGAAAVVVTASPAQVRYDWTTGDVDTVAEYWAWFILTSGGKTQRFPAGRAYIVSIVPGD